MIALKEAYNAGLFKSEHLGKNISAGIVVGIVAMPLAMAFAIASGVSPAQGIYTAIISAFFVSIFGGSRVQIAGPTGAFIVLLSGILMQYGLAGLQIATIMAGIILVLMQVRVPSTSKKAALIFVIFYSSLLYIFLSTFSSFSQV